MSEPFDPYLTWLDIPLKDRPIDHYRLLGVKPFEADTDAIVAAAGQRMAQVKGHSIGPQAEAAKRIMAEIVAARLCLLNPQKKKAYDATLRERAAGPSQPRAKPKLAVAQPLTAAAVGGLAAGAAAGVSGAGPVAAGGAPPPVPALPPKLPTAPAVPAVSAPGQAARPSLVSPRTSRAKKTNPWPIVAACGAGGALLLGLVFLLWHYSKGSTQAEAPAPATPEPSTPATPKPQKTPAIKTIVRRIEKTWSKPRTSAQEKPDPKPERKSKTDEESETEKTSVPDKPDVPAKEPNPATPPDREEDTKPQEEPPATTPSKEEADTRLPEPDEAARKKAEKEVREVFLDTLANAQTPQQRLAAAGELEREAKRGQNAPAVRYVLLRLASRQAFAGGDLNRAMAILDQLAEIFKADVLSAKADMLVEEADALNKPTRGPAARSNADRQQASQQLVVAARDLTKSAMDAGDFQTADRCLKIALPAARRLKDNKLVSTIQASLKEVGRLNQRQAAVNEAETKLKSAPDDREANTLVGDWRCLVLGSWDDGLRCLAKGSEAELAALAKQDLARPRDSAKQVELGDKWWDIAEKKAGVEAARARERSAFWYKRALPRATGLAKQKIKKRLEGLGGGSRYALSFDGQASYVLVPQVRYDGTVPITLEAIVKPQRRTAGGVGGSRWSMHTILGNGSYQGLSMGERYDGWFFQLHARSVTGSSRTETVNTNLREAPAETWTHVAAVYDGQQMRLFTDGQLQGSRALGGPHMPSPLPLTIGAAPVDRTSGDETINNFWGMIRAVRISRTAVYTQNFQPPTELTAATGTVALFRFTEGRGEQLKDSSGRGVIGQIHGAKWVEADEGE